MIRNVQLFFLVLFFFPVLFLGQVTGLSLQINATDAKCNGNANGSATVTVNGGVSPYTFQWLPSGGTGAIASNLNAGVYSVHVTDHNGLSIQDTIRIQEPPLLQVLIDSIIVPACFREISGGGACGCNNTLWALPLGGTAPYTYAWSPGGQTTDSIFQQCYILFAVTVTDKNQCTASNRLNVVIPPSPGTTNIQVNNHMQGIGLFPVPASDQVTLVVQESVHMRHFEVYDIIGNSVLEQYIMAGVTTVSIDISALQEGNYFLRLSDDSGQHHLRFVKSGS